MALRIVELFGYAAADDSAVAHRARRDRYCPFLASTCVKPLRDGQPSGVCTVRQQSDPRPIICCPNRLYANNYEILRDVALLAFRRKYKVVAPDRLRTSRAQRVAVGFGKRWGKELRIPTRKSSSRRRSAYYVDWIIARLTRAGALKSFVAVEVQSIDTTGNYRGERLTLLRSAIPRKASKGGINWENVSKRILPQLIYKGHVLRQEHRCDSGLFFVCPTPVYEKIVERLGNALREYSKPDPGTITFLGYDLGRPVGRGRIRTLRLREQFTTSVDSVALAFTSPSNLPDAGAYEQAISSALEHS